jgi:pimeloyl-ACP methyl ester carboxylesterase
MTSVEHITVGAGVRVAVTRWPAADDDPGVPIILVHGLASNARLWDGAAAALSARGHPVVALDQRGHGASDKPDNGYDMATVADDLAALVEALGWDRPVVAGQSWGGNVVIELAHRRPELVRGVCAVDGGMIELADRFPTWDECAAALRPPDLTGLRATRLEALLRAAHPDWPDAAISGTLANMEVLPDGTVRPWLTLERHLAVLRGLWEHRPTTRFATLAVPVLFCPADSGEVAWTHDKEAALARAESLLARARTVWFRPADHDLHAQHPVRFAEVLHTATTDGFFT